MRLPGPVRDTSLHVAHAVGEGIDRQVRNHHRRRLRKVGWEHAFDGERAGWARDAMEPREGNRAEVLIDGANVLPRMAEDIAAAESHVHLIGWHFSPELDLTRGEQPTILRNLLAERAEHAAVRVLMWKGSPLPVFRPTRGDVGTMLRRFAKSNKIVCASDTCVRQWHCHHEKTIVIDDRIAYVGGIDLTLDGGDPFDTSEHPARSRVGWHDAAIRLEGPIVADVAEHFKMRWEGATDESLPEPTAQGKRGDVGLQLVRTVPEEIFDRSLPRGEFSVLGSYVAALRGAKKLIYLENQFLWSPEIGQVLVDKLENPPSDDFRLVVLLPARANDGADVSRGQVASLIHADDGNGRFLGTTIFARSATMRDTIYVHSKIGIVDDAWFTIGSANLNEHSLFNDSEVNVVTLDEGLARDTRLRLWAEHLERPVEEIDGDSTEVIDELWNPIADEQLERLRADEPITHRLVKLPGVSKRRGRVIGSVKGRFLDG